MFRMSLTGAVYTMLKTLKYASAGWRSWLRLTRKQKIVLLLAMFILGARTHPRPTPAKGSRHIFSSKIVFSESTCGRNVSSDASVTTQELMIYKRSAIFQRCPTHALQCHRCIDDCSNFKCCSACVGPGEKATF